MKNIITLSLFSLFSLFCFANNVSVDNVSITGQNSASNYKFVEFDLSWENSWRTSAGPSNWDAVWVFCKYRATSSSTWSHATLNTTSGNHSAATGSTIAPSSDGKGAFIYQSADGAGNVNFSDLQLRWEYGTDGLLDNDSVEICVFAVEMVYIPTGSFTLGDGNSISLESTAAFHSPYNTSNPVTVSTSLVSDVHADGGYDDAQLTGTATVGIGIDGDGGIDTNDDGTVDNTSFPTGYGAFYIMKHELSQGQYASFLNKLTSAQDLSRFYNTTAYRQTVSGTPGGRVASAPNRAMNYTDWPDLAAYADWSGLRPMTELEFEKAARGSEPSVTGEFAWGNTSLTTSIYTFLYDGAANSSVSNISSGIGNAQYNTTDNNAVGPLRSGIFAASSPNHTRIETGGSYYGVMELSGNLMEYCVTLGRTGGRSYTGTHGDGNLSSNGFANESWPGLNAGVVSRTTASYGFGLRGGSFNIASSAMPISYRAYMNTSYANTSSYYTGIRLVRTAP